MTAPRADRPLRDFRNLLTVIVGHSELLLRELERGDPLRRSAEAILKAAQSGNVLAGELLASARGDEPPAALADPSGPAPAEEAVPAAAARPGETILVVDDEADVRGLIREVLELHGYTVLDARRGDEALVIADRHAGSIDLVVMDVVVSDLMPQEFLARLSRGRPAVRVLCVSGHSDDEIARRMGPVRRRLLRKPFALASLASAVRDALDAPVTDD
jgi:CheY-like chemotaxis protein